MHSIDLFSLANFVITVKIEVHLFLSLDKSLKSTPDDIFYI